MQSRGHAISTRTRRVVNIEDRIVAVEEIFRLQDADEYSAAERLYLSAATAARTAVVLAAGRGRGLEAQTADRPKIMLNIAGKPLLRWLIDSFKKQQINQITVVGGYRADVIETAGIRLVVNERHAQTGELASLACASRRARCGHRDLLWGPAVPQLCAARAGGEQGRILGDRGFLGLRRRQPHGA